MGFIRLGLIFLIISSIILVFRTFPNYRVEQNSNSKLIPYDETPKGLRLIFLDNANKAKISWYTEEQLEDFYFYYLNEGNLKDPMKVIPNIKYFNDIYYYDVDLNHLEENKTYFYNICSQSDESKANKSFTSFPKSADVMNLKFLVWGDTQHDRNVKKIFSERVKRQFDIDFGIHLGDIVKDGNNQYDWNEYFSNTEILNAYIPSYYVEGNHDTLNLYNNLILPSNGNDSYYYSFNYGFAKFLALNTNREVKNQASWIIQELESSNLDNQILWNIAFMHEPIFKSIADETNREDLISLWSSSFDNYGVDIVFSGHDHNYERTYPLSYLKEFNNSELYNFQNPIYPIYMVSGGGGGRLEDLTTGKYVDLGITNSSYIPPSYLAYYKEVYHFLIVDITINLIKNKTLLQTNAWGMMNDGNDIYSDLFLFDTITIEKDLPESYQNLMKVTPH